MGFTYFTSEQFICLTICIIILIASVITFNANKINTALKLLLLCSFLLGLFVSSLDNFLIIWDEQYHALVAKNLMDNPFKPTLYLNPILEYDYTNWTANHIWLHKQPLYLWQIAMSLKIFGINTISVRIPSIIMHSFATYMVYRIGKITCNSEVGFYGSLFFSVAFYLLELSAGKFATDHNDSAFLFYVLASFWSWFEFQHSKKKYWLILIGIFSGCAVLVKWLVGLLIYSVWFIVILLSETNLKNKKKSILHLFYSFLISFILFIPWQIYILQSYPNEAKYEMNLNSEHFFKVIENHGGDFWFHFSAIKNIYGSGIAVPFILLLGIILYLKNTGEKIYRNAIITSILITYGFYSLAATKMTSFTIIVSFWGFLCFAVLADYLFNFIQGKINSKKFNFIFRTLSIVIICMLLLDIPKIENNHTFYKPNDNFNREGDLKQMNLIKKLSTFNFRNNCVVFNADIRLNGHIAVMFYTNFTAYDFIPKKEQIEIIKQKKYKIVVVDKEDLPDFILNDREIIKISHL